MNRAGLDLFALLLERSGRKVVRLSSTAAIRFCCPLHNEDTPSANASVGDRRPVVARCHVCGDEGDLARMLDELGANDEERREILGGEEREHRGTLRVGRERDVRRGADESGKGETSTVLATPNSGVPVPAGAVRETARWVSVDFDGRPYAHVRLEDENGKKTVIWSPKGVRPEELPLYGRAGLREANGALVVVSEGEKASESLRGIPGLVSLGTVTGAEGTPSRRSLEELVGRPVILWPDADDPGFRHMERIGAALEGLAASVAVVYPDATLGPKADAYDFVERYGSEGVFDAIARARPFTEWKRSRIESRRGWARRSAAEIVDAEIAPIPSLLGSGLLPAGYVSIAYGYPGVGKSFLLDAGLALAVARGESWLGLPTRKGRVLVLAAEWPAAIAQQHLRQYGADGAVDLEYVTAEFLRTPILLDSPEHVADLVSYARGFDLVVLDPLGRFSGVDLDAGYEAAKVTLGAQALAASGPAVLLVHHARKTSAGTKESFENDLDAMRGSGRLQSDPVTVIRLAKHPSGKIVISFPKANFGRAPDPLWIEPNFDGPPQITTSPEEGAALRRRKIKEYLGDNPSGTTLEKIANSVKMAPRTVRRYLAEVGAVNLSGRGASALFALPSLPETAA